MDGLGNCACLKICCKYYEFLEKHFDHFYRALRPMLLFLAATDFENIHYGNHGFVDNHLLLEIVFDRIVLSHRFGQRFQKKHLAKHRLYRMSESPKSQIPLLLMTN